MTRLPAFLKKRGLHKEEHRKPTALLDSANVESGTVALSRVLKTSTVGLRKA
jgi:hypothetical protein